MIGKLRGIIDTIHNESIILDVNGVGYVVACSAYTLRRLPGKGEAAVLLIDTKIAEDRFDLYGFLDEAERQWYRELIKINGVSSKTAITILSALTPGQLNTAIAAQDTSALKKANGIGPKLATRIVTELKDKFTGLESTSPLPTAAPTAQAETSTGNNVVQDAVSALVNLGYGRSEAFMVVNRILQQSPDTTLSEAIRLSLKALAKETA